MLKTNKHGLSLMYTSDQEVTTLTLHHHSVRKNNKMPENLTISTNDYSIDCIFRIFLV